MADLEAARNDGILSVKSVNIHTVFGRKLCQILGNHSTVGLMPYLGNPGSTSGSCFMLRF